MRCWTGFRLRVIVAHLGPTSSEVFLDMVQARENAWLDYHGAHGFMQQLRPFPVGRLAQLRALSGQGKSCSGRISRTFPIPPTEVRVLSDQSGHARGAGAPDRKLFGGQASGLL